MFQEQLGLALDGKLNVVEYTKNITKKLVKLQAYVVNFS